jgi:hypothetical protein
MIKEQGRNGLTTDKDRAGILIGVQSRYGSFEKFKIKNIPNVIEVMRRHHCTR